MTPPAPVTRSRTCLSYCATSRSSFRKCRPYPLEQCCPRTSVCESRTCVLASASHLSRISGSARRTRCWTAWCKTRWRRSSSRSRAWGSSRPTWAALFRICSPPLKISTSSLASMCVGRAASTRRSPSIARSSSAGSCSTRWSASWSTTSRLRPSPCFTSRRCTHKPSPIASRGRPATPPVLRSRHSRLAMRTGLSSKPRLRSQPSRPNQRTAQAAPSPSCLAAGRRTAARTR
mmetsp:Transcript_16677/g.42394  ORF Transcript_16677/g.42394 Transcript_16677/m.42394 type:complete len:233 (-) Transcript_16677:1029-1727(-)